MVGLTLVIVGAPEVPTTNGEPLVAEPDGVVTDIVPVVAPEGTVVWMVVVVLESTVAATPLNDTVFWLAVALKPIPYRVTPLPTGAPFGVNSTMTTEPAVCRDMDSRFPAAS
jgi:hypothetical protein